MQICKTLKKTKRKPQQLPPQIFSVIKTSVPEQSLHNQATKKALPCKPLNLCYLQEQWQQHKTAISAFNSTFLLQPEATQTTGSPQVPIYVFLRNWQPLIIHFLNHIWVSPWVMSPSEAQRWATSIPSLARPHSVLVCTRDELSNPISCQLLVRAVLDVRYQTTPLTPFPSRSLRLPGLRGRGWHLWVCIKQRELIHQLLSKQSVYKRIPND